MRIVRYTHPNSPLAPLGAFDRSPWSGLESEIDRLFSSALTDLVGGAGADRFPVDLYEDSDNAYVRAELPGLSRDDISVEVVEGYLNVEASRKTKDGDREQTFRFSRSVALPDDVRADAVTAAYEHGVLTVTLPKKEEAKPRKISVSVK